MANVGQNPSGQGVLNFAPQIDPIHTLFMDSRMDPLSPVRNGLHGMGNFGTFPFEIRQLIFLYMAYVPVVHDLDAYEFYGSPIPLICHEAYRSTFSTFNILTNQLGADWRRADLKIRPGKMRFVHFDRDIFLFRSKLASREWWTAGSQQQIQLASDSLALTDTVMSWSFRHVRHMRMSAVWCFLCNRDRLMLFGHTELLNTVDELAWLLYCEIDAFHRTACGRPGGAWETFTVMIGPCPEHYWWALENVFDLHGQETNSLKEALLKHYHIHRPLVVNNHLQHWKRGLQLSLMCEGAIPLDGNDPTAVFEKGAYEIAGYTVN